MKRNTAFHAVALGNVFIISFLWNVFLRSCYKYTLSYVNVLALLAYSYSLSIISKVQFKQSLLWH